MRIVDILIVDKTKARRENLQLMLTPFSSTLVALEVCDEVDKHYDVVLAHRNNFDEVTERTFEEFATKQRAEIIWFTGGTQGGDLRLVQGNEYGTEHWKRGLDDYCKDKNINNFLAWMYMTEAEEVVNFISPLLLLAPKENVSEIKKIAFWVEGKLLEKSQKPCWQRLKITWPDFEEKVSCKVSSIVKEPSVNDVSSLIEDLRKEFLDFSWRRL